jgi:hypothetical protein
MNWLFKVAIQNLEKLLNLTKLEELKSGHSNLVQPFKISLPLSFFLTPLFIDGFLLLILSLQKGIASTGSQSL